MCTQVANHLLVNFLNNIFCAFPSTVHRFRCVIKFLSISLTHHHLDQGEQATIQNIQWARIKKKHKSKLPPW